MPPPPPAAPRRPPPPPPRPRRGARLRGATVVGWLDMPEAGDELHHFGWNACSSALCHTGHDPDHMERRWLLVPGGPRASTSSTPGPTPVSPTSTG
ncbi:MAG: selenium-binding protein SBP56-related protein [Acidimicrobiales bacterium]